jgi:hypothetical protein
LVGNCKQPGSCTIGSGLNREERNAKIIFTNISWANYLVVITLLLAAYYLVIAIRFYFHELQTYIAGLLKPDQTTVQTKPSRFPTPPLPNKWPENSETPNHSGNYPDNPAREEDGISDYPQEAIAEAIQKAGDQAE